MNDKSSIQMSVIYDNNPLEEGLMPDWGFSCLVKGLEKSILFDTGTKGQILLANMEKLEISPMDVDLVVLSHDHRDHTGGLNDFLDRNSKIEVWLPHFFSVEFKEKIRKKGAKVFEVNDSKKICEGAHSSGVIDGWIKEQSLVIDTEKGLVLMTGCAHPKITRIVTRVKELFKKEIYLALGGFHLAGFDRAEIKEIIDEFRASGVLKAGPCHCSGDEARMLFHEEYQEDFLNIGVGKKLEV